MKETWGAAEAMCSFSETQFLSSSLSWLALLPPSHHSIPSHTPTHISSLLYPVPHSLAPFAHLPQSHQSACAFPSLLRSLPWLSAVLQEKPISSTEHAGSCWLFLISLACVTTAPMDRPRLAVPEHTRLSPAYVLLKCCAFDWSLGLQILSPMLSTSSVKFSVYTQAKVGVPSLFCSLSNTNIFLLYCHIIL